MDDEKNDEAEDENDTNGWIWKWWKWFKWQKMNEDQNDKNGWRWEWWSRNWQKQFLTTSIIEVLKSDGSNEKSVQLFSKLQTGHENWLHVECRTDIATIK